MEPFWFSWDNWALRCWSSAFSTLQWGSNYYLDWIWVFKRREWSFGVNSLDYIHKWWFEALLQSRNQLLIVLQSVECHVCGSYLLEFCDIFLWIIYSSTTKLLKCNTKLQFVLSLEDACVREFKMDHLSNHKNLVLKVWALA